MQSYTTYAFYSRHLLPLTRIAFVLFIYYLFQTAIHLWHCPNCRLFGTMLRNIFVSVLCRQSAKRVVRVFGFQLRSAFRSKRKTGNSSTCSVRSLDVPSNMSPQLEAGEMPTTWVWCKTLRMCMRWLPKEKEDQQDENAASVCEITWLSCKLRESRSTKELNKSYCVKVRYSNREWERYEWRDIEMFMNLVCTTRELRREKLTVI